MAPLNGSRSGGWRAVIAPLASFWAILLTVLIVFAMNGPGWLELLAERDQNPARKMDREIMRDVRQRTVAGAEATASRGTAEQTR